VQKVKYNKGCTELPYCGTLNNCRTRQHFLAVLLVSFTQGVIT